MLTKDLQDAISSVGTNRIREAAERFKQDQMIQWLQEVAGLQLRLTVSQLHEILKDKLPKEPHYQQEIMDAIIQRFGADAIVWKEAAGPYSQKGIPDVTCILMGHYFGFEVKRPIIGRLSNIQAARIRQINRAGGTALAVCSAKQAIEVIEKWKIKNRTAG